MITENEAQTQNCGSKKSNHKTNQKGQVAIFVILIFQVLFVFFAMLVNVGLLIHHKINLQNSVDLAAYYGAQKQAEILNFVGHTNFQIRQSWKLFAWRFRILGGFGSDSFPGRVLPPGTATNIFLNKKDNDSIPPPLTNNKPPDQPAPVFCLLYRPWNHMNASSPPENYCRYASFNATQIRLPTPPGFVAGNIAIPGLTGISTSVIAATTAANANIVEDCRAKNYISLYGLYLYLWAYKRDIMNRKKLAIVMAQRLSQSDTDFTDLEGGKAFDGVKNTFLNNLTYQNREGSPDVKFYNSMGASGCGQNGGGFEAPLWLNEVNIYPITWATVANCGTAGTAANLTYSAIAANVPGQIDTVQSFFDPTFYSQYLSPLSQYLYEPDGTNPEDRLRKSSVGFEKNPYCATYVGVSATAKPKLPFSPFGSVEIKAKAFAKPFGAQIGPSYGAGWQGAGAQNSNMINRIDRFIPPRVLKGETLNNLNDYTTYPNHARYQGDEAGLGSYLTYFFMAKGFQAKYDAAAGPNMYLEWWDHLLDKNKEPEFMTGDGDLLAYSEDPAKPGWENMRDMELSAIAPDQFDISNYPIEPDYIGNYYSKLVGQQSQGAQDLATINLRGDLGMRKNGPALWQQFTVKDQIKRLHDDGKETFPTNAGELSYFVKSYFEVLNWFKSKAPDNPVFDDATFASCGSNTPNSRNPKLNEADAEAKPIGSLTKPEYATTGNCTKGGRLGYSVKLVSPDFLNSTQVEWGGTGNAGAVRNPPTNMPAGF